MSTQKVDIDISDFLAKTRQIEAGYDKQISSVQELIKTVIRFNSLGEEMSGTAKAQISANDELSISYRKVGGVLQVIGATATKTAEAMRKAREEQQKIASSANLKTVDQNILGKKRFQGEDLQKLDKIKSAIAGLNATIVDPNVIKGFLDQLRSGKSIEATGTLGKLRDELQKLVTMENRLTTTASNKELSRKVLGRFGEFTKQELVPIKFGINDADLKAKAKQTIRNALENIREEVKVDPTINIGKIREIFSQLKANPLQVFENTGDQRIANQLSRILNVYKQIEDTKRRQSQLDSNQLDKAGKTAAQIEREDKRTSLIAQRIRQQTILPQQNRLGTIMPGLGIDEGKLTVLGRKIAELGRQAGLSSRQVMEIFGAVNRGDFSQIEGKYNRLTQKIIQYNKQIESELKNVSNGILKSGGIGGSGGGRGGSPGNLGPDGPTLSRAKEFGSMLEKIKTSLQFFFIYKGFSTITDGFSAATKAAAEYEDRVSLIRTISQESQLSTQQWTDGLSKLSSKLGVEFVDVAKAAYDAVSNQIAQGTDVFKFVEQAGNLAKTTNSSLQDSTNLLSSVVNTYGVEAGTVEEISAKLFKTIDRGRIVASEMSNTFGRVAFTAKDAGVSFDEVNATLALLTRSGVTTEDAMTLVNNLMLQLRKPSAELQKVFEDIGVGSADNAVKIKGFVGILKELQGAVSSGKIDISKMFPEIRAERAATFLLGKTDDIVKEVKIIGEESRDTFQKAIEIRDEPIIQKINKLKNTIQNALAATVGQGFNTMIVGLAEKVTGQDINTMVKDQKSLEEAIDKVQFAFSRAVRVVAAFGAGLVALKVSSSAFAIVNELVAASTQKNLAIEALMNAKKVEGIAITRQQAAAELQLNAVRNGGGGASVGRFGGAMGLAATAIITGITAYSAYKAAVVDTFSTSSQALDDFYKKLQEDKVSKVLNKEVDALTEIRKQFSDVTKPALQASSGALGDINNKIINIRASSAKVGETLKSNFIGYLDIAKNRIQDAERAMAQLQNRIEASGKASLGFRQKLDDIVYGLQSQYATDPQFLQLTQNQVSENIRKIKQLYATGTEEGVAQARELFDKTADLQSQFAQRQMAMQVKQTEANGGGVVFFDQREILKAQNSLVQLRDGLEAGLTAKLVDQKKELETNIALQKSKLDEFQKALTKFEEFSPSDAAGATKPEFKTFTGKTDVEKIKAEYDRLAKAITKGMDEVDSANAKTGEKPTSVAERLNITKLIAERKKSVEEEINATSKQKDLIQLQDKLIQASENKQKALDGEIKKYDEYNKKLTETAGLLELLNKNNLEQASKFEETFGKLVSEALFPTKAGRGLGGVLKDISGVFGAKPGLMYNDKLYNGDISGPLKKFEDAQKKIGDATKNKVKIDGKDVIDIDSVKKAVEEYDTTFAELRKKVNENIDALNEGKKDGSFSEDTANKMQAIVKELNRNDEILLKLKSMVAEADKAKPVGNTVEKAQADVDNLKAKVNDIGSTRDAIQGVTAAMGGIGQAARDSGNDVDNLIMKLKEAVKIQQEGNIRPQEEPQRKAYGGPIGHDNIPIWARGGEIVANKQASTDNYSQIMAMNNTSRIPQYFSQGGMVGGDTFNITVNESKTPQLTARQIHAAVRSNQRRG